MQAIVVAKDIAHGGGITYSPTPRPSAARIVGRLGNAGAIDRRISIDPGVEGDRPHPVALMVFVDGVNFFEVQSLSRSSGSV